MPWRLLAATVRTVARFTEWISSLSKESSEPNADEKTNHSAKLFIGAFRRKRVLDLVMAKARSSGFRNVGTPPSASSMPGASTSALASFNLEEARKPQEPAPVNSLSHRWGQVVASVIRNDNDHRHALLDRLKRLGLEEEKHKGEMGAGGAHATTTHGTMRWSTGSFPEDYYTLSKSARRRMRRSMANQKRRDKIENTKEHVEQMKQLGMQSLAAICRKQNRSRRSDGAGLPASGSSDDWLSPNDDARPGASGDDVAVTSATSPGSKSPRKPGVSFDMSRFEGDARHANVDTTGGAEADVSPTQGRKGRNPRAQGSYYQGRSSEGGAAGNPSNRDGVQVGLDGFRHGEGRPRDPARVRDRGASGQLLSPTSHSQSPRELRNGTNLAPSGGLGTHRTGGERGPPRGHEGSQPGHAPHGTVVTSSGVSLPALGGRIPALQDAPKEPEWMASLKKTLSAREARPRVHRSSKMLATPRPPGVSPAKHVGSLLVLDDSQWSTSGSRSLPTDHALWSQISHRAAGAEVGAGGGSLTDRGPRGSGLARGDITRLL
eukprot:jgi/Mesvir1/13907/Mv16031-RA.2